MNFIDTKIDGLLVIEPSVFGDERGAFFESFNQNNFDKALKERGLPTVHFVQDNHSISQKAVLRGLHYQLPPFAQGKLVRVVKGAVFDIAVDVRKDSKSFGQWYGIILSADNRRQFWIPEGFAHGFLALEDDTHFLYKTTNFYDPKSEQSILWSDQTLKIDWSLADFQIAQPILSPKDAVAKSFEQVEYF